MNYRRHEAAMLGEVRRLFRRQRAQARARVLGKQGRKGTRHWMPPTYGKAIDPRRVFNADAWKRETADLLGGVLYDITRQTGDALFDLFREPAKQLVPQGAAFNVHNPLVTEALDRRTARLVQMNDTTQAAIERSLTQGEAAGESIRQLAGRVDGVFGDALGYRSELIARTEVVGAVNEGNFYAGKQTGLDLKKQWLATLDNRTRPWHAEADGQEVGIDEPFDIGGEELDYPGDPAGSTENTAACRCTIVYTGDDLALAPGTTEEDSLAAYDEPLPGLDQPEARAAEALIRTDDALRAGLDSLHVHDLIDGQEFRWSAERAAKHDQLINEALAKVQRAGVPQNRESVMMGGLPGAGKSSTAGKLFDESKFATVNPDEFKAALVKANMQDFVPEGMFPMEASSLLHEESSYLAKRFADRLMADGYNVLYDITMNAPKGVEQRLALLAGNDYKVDAYFVDVPVDQSAQSVVARYGRQLERDPLDARLVPPEAYYGQVDATWGSKNRATFEFVKDRFDHWTLIDNTDHAGTVVATG